MGTLSLDTLDIVNPDLYVERGYPHQEWALLRREAPVFWYERQNAVPFWAVTKHEDIVTVSRQPELFRSNQILFITAGSGITPVMAMLRTLRSRGQHADIAHIHSAPGTDEVIFHDELRELENTQQGYRLHLQLTQTQGHIDFQHLADIVADWRERPAWVCGPPALLDTVEEVWKGAGCSDQLHLERFTIAATDKGGEGGTVTFAISDKTIDIDGATSLLEAGEKVGIQMPFGCRMGICQTCVLPLESGHVRDFRSGIEHREGDRIQTCISTASGNCTIKI